MSRNKLKNDRYKKNRGGYSRLLNLSCEKCGKHLFYYQKDGSGILKRLYIDRISIDPLKTTNLVCSGCKQLLGVKIIYKKENRPAFRLFAGAITKKIIRSNKVLEKK